MLLIYGSLFLKKYKITEKNCLMGTAKQKAKPALLNIKISFLDQGGSENLLISGTQQRELYS